MQNTKKIMVFTCLILFLFFGRAFAAENKYDVVHSNGSVTQEVAPDTAFVSMGVVTRGKTAEEARAANAAVMEEVDSSLGVFGISGDEVKTTGYYLRPEYSDYAKGKRVITGYTLTYNLSVTIDDVDKVGAVIDSMFAAGANTFNGVTFTVSNRKAIERELLALALVNAREKAAAVASAGGRSLGKLVAANIGSLGGMELTESNYDLALMRKADAGETPPPTQIMAGSLKVSAYVDASFELL